MKSLGDNSFIHSERRRFL